MQLSPTVVLRALLSLLPLLTAVTVLADGPAVWHQRVDEATAIAQKENKDILIRFTGHDWCGWSRKMDNEIVQHAKFNQLAEEKFICVTLDFPRNEPLPLVQRLYNESMRDLYRVFSYPTLILCDASGKPYARTHYHRTKGEKFIKHLESLSKRKQGRDQAFQDAEDLTGVEKARAIERALTQLPLLNLSHYPEKIAAIQEADPDDASGFMGKYALMETGFALKKLVHADMQENDFASVRKKIDDYITETKPTGESKQLALMIKLKSHVSEQDYPSAVQLADKIIAISDTSRTGRFCKMYRKHIISLQEQAKEEQGE